MKTYLPQEYVLATYNTSSEKNLGAFILLIWLNHAISYVETILISSHGIKYVSSVCNKSMKR